MRDRRWPSWPMNDPRSRQRHSVALEHRPYWRPGEGEFVLQFGQVSDEPAVRAAAIHALAGYEYAGIGHGCGGFLRDPSPEVRQAAAEALMWEPNSRWPFARDGVREALADPKLAGEGSMFISIGRIPAAAVADLTTWSSEHPPLAHRAILTLIDHYHAELLTEERPELASELAALMLNPETSPGAARRAGRAVYATIICFRPTCSIA